MPAYTFVAAGTISQTSPGQPSGKQAGDLLLCATGHRANARTFAVPTGYTTLVDGTGTGSVALCARIATNDASDNISSHAFWTGGGGNYRSQIAAFRGDIHTDLGTIVAHSAVAGSASGFNDIPNPALTISTDDCLVIGIGAKAKDAVSNGATLTSPTGLNNRIGFDWVSGDIEVGFVWDYTQQTTATSISASVWDQSIEETNQYGSLIVALKTASATVVLPLLRTTGVLGKQLIR